MRLPHWLLTIAPATILALWLLLRWHNRILPNHCRQCGYDLTGTLMAGRTECPECGAAIPMSVTLGAEATG